MRIVVVYTESDGCSYSFTETFPIVRDSVEAAFVEFDDALNNAKNGVFTVFGMDFNAYYVKKNGYPSFHTVDEWFAEVEKA